MIGLSRLTSLCVNVACVRVRVLAFLEVVDVVAHTETVIVCAIVLGLLNERERCVRARFWEGNSVRPYNAVGGRGDGPWRGMVYVQCEEIAKRCGHIVVGKFYSVELKVEGRRIVSLTPFGNISITALESSCATIAYGTCAVLHMCSI